MNKYNVINACVQFTFFVIYRKVVLNILQEKASIYLKIAIRGDDELLWWQQGVKAIAETALDVQAHTALQSQGDPTRLP